MDIKTKYWISTGIVLLFLVWSSYTYLFHKNTIVGIRALGFPDFFRIQLAVLKIIACLLLVIPMVPVVAKEWAYLGIALFFITAIVAHLAHKDPFWISLINVLMIGVLMVSYTTFHQLR